MPNGGLLSLLEGLIPAAFLIIGMLLELYRRSQGRVLSYEVELMPVFRTRQDFDDRIQVKYGDMPVGSLYSCRVAIRNRGSVSLSEQPILIELKENVTVLEDRFKTTPELEFGEIVVDEESSNEWRRRYKVKLINPGDEITVNLTVAGGLALSDISVDARGGGLACLPEPSYATREHIYRLFGLAVWLLLATGLLIWLKFGAPLILWSGLVPTLIGNRFEYYRNRWRSPRKRLSYQIVAPSPVYTMADSYRGKVSVEYTGRTVRDLYTSRVLLRNTGNRSLKNQNVLVQLKGANILESSIHTEPELEFESVRPGDGLGRDRRRYYFPELEPKDEVTIDFAFEGMISLKDIGVGARGEMLKVEPEWEGWKFVSLVATAENVTWLLAGLVSLLAALLFALPFGTGGMNALSELGYLIWQWLVGVSGQPGFFTGVLIGALGLGLVAFVVFQVQVWWGNVKAPFRPQTVTHKTDKTLAQIVRGSCATFVLGIMVFLCVVSLLVEIAIPGALLRVLEAVGLAD
jgi:hypothetical protein